MQVLIAIVGYRNAGDVIACVAALERQRFTDFRVAICENGGDEAVAALRGSLPERLAGGQSLQIIDAGGNIGFAAGVNRCLGDLGEAEAAWVLNPDTVPAEDALARLVARLERADCDAVGARIVWADGVSQSHGGRWLAWLARAVSLGQGVAAGARVDQAAVEARLSYLSGAAMLVSRRFLRLAGPMREDYFLYCEEVDWCLGACVAGARLGFEPEAMVVHGYGRSTGAGAPIRALPRLPVYLNERNRLLLTRDRFPAILPVASLGALGLIVLRFARRGAWRQTGYALAGWAAGIMNRRGPPTWVTDAISHQPPPAN